MSKHRILIVDDEPNIVMALEYAFKKRDFEVYIARDGHEALALAKEKLPHIVLMDIMMPQMDGYETLQAIKSVEQLSDSKVIFLSAKNKSLDIQKGLDLGASRYITKPFSVKKVVEEIESII